MLSVFRPSLEVVNEGRFFLTEKMSWKYSSHQQEYHLISIVVVKVKGEQILYDK
jgi:hypothetical protein